MAGNTFKLSLRRVARDSADSWLSRQTIDRRRAPLHRGCVANGVFAVRFKGFKSWGRNPDFIYFGGNSEMRGYEYLAVHRPEGLLRQRRAALPADRGDADADRRPRRPARRRSSPTSAARGFNGQHVHVHGEQRRRALHAAHRLRDRRLPRQRRAGLRPAARRRAASGSSTAAPRTASASRASCSASRCTSTGPGRRCSTATGKNALFAPTLRSAGEFRWIGTTADAIPEGEVLVLDRLRLLTAGCRQTSRRLRSPRWCRSCCRTTRTRSGSSSAARSCTSSTSPARSPVTGTRAACS